MLNGLIIVTGNANEEKYENANWSAAILLAE